MKNRYLLSLRKTFNVIQKSPYRFLLSILSDFVLVVLSLGIFYYAFVRLLPHLEVMVEAMAGGLSGELNAAFYSHYHSAFGIIVSFVLALFVVFVLLKGSNYKLFVLDKKGYLRYMVKFAGVNVIWGILLFLLLSLYLNFVFSTAMVLNPLISLKAAGLLFYICCIVVVYFASLSYAAIDKGFLPGLKKAFVVGVKKADMLAGIFLIIAVFVYLMKYVALKYPLAGAVFGFFILLPMIGFNRMFVKEVMKKK